MTGASRNAEAGLVVAVAHHPSDTGHAEELITFLRGAQVTVTAAAAAAADEDAGSDGVVVLLSAAALADPLWLEDADLRGRVVPVRIGLIDGLPVPRGLSELNYLDWPAGRNEVVFGQVLAALATDPARRDFLRQLTREAQAWQDAGQPVQLLLHDRRRGRKAVDTVRDAAADTSTVLPPVTALFADRSAAALKTQHRVRWARVLVILATVLVLLGVAAWQYPQIRLGGNNNRSAITTAGDLDTLEAMPEWTAIHSAALLVNGNAAQRGLARASLLSAMSRPWAISMLQNLRSLGTAALFDRGRQAVVTFQSRGKTQLAVVDVRTTEIAWRIPLPGVYPYVSVTPDGGAAVVSGNSGVAGVDLRARTVRPLLTGVFYGNATAGDGRAAVWGTDGTMESFALVDTGTGVITRTGRYPAMLSMRTAGTGAAALVRPADGRLRLVDVVSGRTLAETGSVPYSQGTGDIAPDGMRAAVEGDDGQLWTFGAGKPAEPTGIPVRFGHVEVLWASADRVVMSSADHPAEVYQLSPAARLGTMCVDINQPVEIRQDAGSDTVACVSKVGISFYELPAGRDADRAGPVPGCAGCESDAGLLDAFRARLTGCFNSNQVDRIDEKTRRNLGVRTCAEPIGDK
jgi:hypothetical protein